MARFEHVDLDLDAEATRKIVRALTDYRSIEFVRVESPDGTLTYEIRGWYEAEIGRPPESSGVRQDGSNGPDAETARDY